MKIHVPNSLIQAPVRIQLYCALGCDPCICSDGCVRVRLPGLVRRAAEDLRGLVRVAGQRRPEQTAEHHDPEVPAVLQALQPQDQVR